MDKESSKSLFSLLCCPNIYGINFESSSLNEVLSVFEDEILLDCCSSSAEYALVEYLTRIVEPIGWKAVWRSTRKSSIVDSELDFIVEVVNVGIVRGW
nr:SHC SH2 domain-binding protein 1 [Parasteatoda tepidariorum]